MTEDKFWEIIEIVNWASDCDYKRIKPWFLNNVPKEEAEAFHDIMSEKWGLLDDMIGDARNPSGGGDDSYCDLIHHVIGLGKEQFEAHLNDYELMAVRGEAEYGTQEGYSESFAYAIPYEDDYDKFNNDSFMVEWANRTSKELEELITLDSRDDLEPIIDGILFVKDEVRLVLDKKYQEFVDNEDLTVKHLDKIEKFFKDRYMDLPRKLTSNGFRGFNTWQVKNMYGDIRLYILKIPEVA